jgi:sugar phosphate isomerase/epimerase
MKKWAFIILLGIAGQSHGWGQSYNRYLKPKPGIVSYTFRNQFSKDIPGTLDYIRSLGIDNIEFSNLFGQVAYDLKVMIDRRGIKCTSYGVSLDDLMKKRTVVIENAKILGANYVRVAWVPHDKPWDLEFAKKTAMLFNEIGKDLHEHGLVFCYHNHGYEFQPYGKGTLFDVLVQETNPAYVSFEIDILWVHHPGQDPAKLIRKYPKRFKLMHIKDLKKGVVGDLTGNTPTENDVTLGTGQIDLIRVFKAARKSSIVHFYIEDENNNSWSQVPESLKYLKSM